MGAEDSVALLEIVEEYADLICSGELGQYPLQGLTEIEDEQIDPRS